MSCPLGDLICDGCSLSLVLQFIGDVSDKVHVNLKGRVAEDFNDQLLFAIVQNCFTRSNIYRASEGIVDFSDACELL